MHTMKSGHEFFADFFFRLGAGKRHHSIAGFSFSLGSNVKFLQPDLSFWVHQTAVFTRPEKSQDEQVIFVIYFLMQLFFLLQSFS